MCLLKKSQDAHLEAISKNKPNVAELEKIVQFHKKLVDQRTEEKTVLVAQLADIAQISLSRITRDVQNVEVYLKQTGELEDIPEPIIPVSSSSIAVPSTPPPQSTTPSAVTTPSPVPASTSIPQTAINTPISAMTISRKGGSNTNRLAPGAFVAAPIQTVTDGVPGPELWILAKILESPQEGFVTVVDADPDSEQKYTLSDKQVVPLIEDEDLSHAKARLGTSKGKTVMALYPETTSFYAATLAQTPFRNNNTESDPNLIGKICVSCIFVDDEDPSTGIAPKRLVPVRSVFIL